MKEFVHGFFGRHFPEAEFLCLVHEGKNDLQASIGRKVRRWNHPGDRILILHDSDNNNCKALKAHLSELCGPEPRVRLKIRVVCQELEAWYLGQPAVVNEVYGTRFDTRVGSAAKKIQMQYRSPHG